MFYVNSSTENTLDPMPCKTTSEADTLIGLFQKNSSKFRKAFREILERKASAHPFENVHSMLPPNSWLGMYPQPDHKRDTARAENALTLSYGSELIGMQRDWNEELQSCWEFPHTTPQERILRDRALYKVTCDFVDAAVTGAVGVVSRCIPPINPTDPECFHMHVHNNIFFSFAVDADVEELSKKHSSDINKRIASSSPVDGLSGKTSNNGTGGVPNGGLGMEEHSSVTSAEVQLADNEQATYASANNDLKGTKAYQEADVPGLYNLAMAIVDYRGYRVVAQSILPGILQGDKSDSLLYGSVDNGKKICWNENFHAKVLEAAKRLHLKEHAVLDDSGNVFKLAAPVECKGIVGSDERHYILDLMRVTPRDANYMGAGARFCILRPELITTFCRAKDVDRLKQKVNSGERVHDVSGILDCGNIKEMETKEDILPVLSDTSEINEDMHGLECGPSSDGNTEFCEDILFNPNVFTDIKLSGNPQEIAADEEGVRKASSYLSEIVLPKFIQDLCNLEMSPMDGETLTEALHASGINVRYVGKVANGTKHLPHLWDLCINEIVVRSAKHILKDVLRDTEDHNIGPAISHFFNCFFGNCKASVQNSTNGTLYRTHKKDNSSHHFHGNSRRQVKSKGGFSAEKNHSTYMNLSSERLWSDIVELAMLKYQLELPEDAKFRVKKIAVIRNLCQKVGITVAARKFDLDAEKPFQTLDILNLQPVIKHSVPCCSEAKELLDAGKTQMAEGMLSESYTLFSEAFSILQQVTGPMHRDVASCCRYLAMVLYHAGDMGGAIMQQHKELIINERCLGLDHPDTAHSYGNMALFYHGLNQTELALRYMSRALLLLSLSSGPDHPDVAATFINVAMMYQDMGKMQTALRYLQEALNTNEKLLGKDHIQTAVCYHALAIAFNCMRAYKLSHQHEKKTYDILVKQLGSEDARTRDSETWLNTFKMRELQLNAQKQKGQVLDAASTQKAIDILKANPDLIHAFQAAATSSGSTNKSLNSAVMGETTLPPRGGRGVDERATRAAAEARKKAIARGVLIRPPHGGVSVHHPQPMTQLFNIINNSSGVALKQPESGESVEETPVGLGRGFASLDVKKVKAKDGPKKSD